MMEGLSIRIRNHSNAILGVSVPIIFLFIFDFDDVTTIVHYILYAEQPLVAKSTPSRGQYVYCTKLIFFKFIHTLLACSG